MSASLSYAAANSVLMTMGTTKICSVLLITLSAVLVSCSAASDPQGESEGPPSGMTQDAGNTPAMSDTGSTDDDMTKTEDDGMADSGPDTADADGAMAKPDQEAATPATEETKREVATLGAGCYWCIEAVLEQVDGIESVVSGFMGGHVKDPKYSQVVRGTTGHAEVVQVTFDPSEITYAEVLDWFWRLHDPTTLNRQGPDVGTQYRSAIFTHSEAQRKIAEASKKDVQPTFKDPIVTEISAASEFYEAKEDHQGFYFNNRSQGYCRGVIQPKLKKLGLKY